MKIKIIGYDCTICNAHHEEGTEIFKEHYDKHFEANGNYVGLSASGIFKYEWVEYPMDST
jgi:hypothetical protein